jgi:hypothetical protein
LELKHLPPSGILHATAFVTLCEAFLGVESPLNLWSHFFRVRLRHDSGVGVASLGSVDISVCTGTGTEPYFLIPQPGPLVGWWKTWFLLKDEAEALLPTFMGGCPIPHPYWEFGVTQSDFPHLQPLLKMVQGLLKKGLTGEEILQTFLSHGVQPLRQ